jgi:hypothetical protein
VGMIRATPQVGPGAVHHATGFNFSAAFVICPAVAYNETGCPGPQPGDSVLRFSREDGSSCKRTRRAFPCIFWHRQVTLRRVSRIAGFFLESRRSVRQVRAPHPSRRWSAITMTDRMDAG